jgi:sugar phosphate isomerase/epimerase
MKLSFCTLATPNVDITEIVKLAARFGYQGLDLRISDSFGELAPDASSDRIRYVKDLLEAENLKVAGLFCYNKGGSEDPASWGAMEDSILRLIDLAGSLGSPSIRIGTGNPRTAADKEDYYKRTAQTIYNVLSKDRSDMELHIQNHSGSYDVTQTYKLVKLVNNHRFKMAFAPEHCMIENENLDEVFNIAKEIAAQLHVCDILKEAGKFPEVLPGHGITPIREAYKAIGGTDFPGWITFKWEKQWHPELMPAEESLPKFIEYAKANF